MKKADCSYCKNSEGLDEHTDHCPIMVNNKGTFVLPHEHKCFMCDRARGFRERVIIFNEPKFPKIEITDDDITEVPF
jgi:hypothetical protein